VKKTLFRSKTRLAVYIFDGTMEMAAELVRLAPVKSRIELNPHPVVEAHNSYGVARIEKGDGVADYGTGELNRIPKKELETEWEIE
jgi:hypothetical protein